MESGAWYLVRWLDCSLFDGESCTCSVHGTSRQPKVCVHFNAYDCWFRQILVGEARRALRLDLTRFERFVAAVEIDEDGRITSLPSFDETSRLVANLKIRPSFPALPLREATVRRLDTREA